MTTAKINPQALRKRKFLLILPLIVFPIVTLLFWVFGGGQGEQAKAATTKGLSMKLPGSLLAGDSSGDKLGFYERAKADSAKQQQLRRADPFFRISPDTSGYTGNLFPPHQPAFTGVGAGEPASPAASAEQISRRLEQLEAEINKPATKSFPESPPPVVHPGLPDSLLQPKTAEDPELKQMNNMLEKILDIQHPERVKAATITGPEKPPVKKFRAIPAVVDGNQKIVQGTVIRMKLLDTITLDRQLFQKGQKLYGSGTLAGQRYTLNIKSIHVGASFYPVDLTVFDEADGMQGISVPEAITGDAMRDGAVNGVQGVDVMSFDPSITTQLATAGINTAKGLFGKKIKQVKAKLKDGHGLLLRNNQEVKQNQQ